MKQGTFLEPLSSDNSQNCVGLFSAPTVIAAGAVGEINAIMLSMRIFIRHPLPKTKGFTLIELLTVIAIIAILAAIIFPVFFGVMEKSRQATAISHMRQISDAIAKYKLDNHRYPDVLFGYASSGVAMNGALAQAKAGNTVANTFPGLYPTYINDVEVFTDPDNPTNSSASDTVPVTVNTRVGATVNMNVPKLFYKADAFDASPIITNANTNTLDTSNYAVRYQPFWVDISGGPTPPGGVAVADYNRQLLWPTHTGDTYVTSTTWHVPHGKVLILFDNGTAKVIDPVKFVGSGPDAAVSGAKFWTLSPSS